MTIDELQVLISANTQNFQKQLDGVRKDLTNLNKTATGVSSRIPKSLGMAGTAVVALGGVISNVISGAFNSLASSAGDAVSRLDTLNNYPRVMESLGFATADSAKSIKLLSDSILGLPTSLDQIVSSTQQLATVSPNLASATHRAIALNNALLAGGAGADSASRAMIQFNQMLSTGKADMQSWNSIVMTMPGQMKQLAQSMLGAGASQSQLKSAIDSGKISVQQLADEMVKLNTNGVAGFGSFADQARNATGGVGTAMANVRTAIVRGMADIMNAIGQANIAGFFNGISRAINAVIPYVVAFIKVIAMAIGWVRQLFGGGSVAKQANDMATSVGATSDAMGGVAGNAEDASDAIGGASKKAKELKKQLAGFDEMNVLDDKSSDSGSGGGAGAGAGAGGMAMDFGDIDTGLNGLSKVDEKVQQILGFLRSIGDVFKTIWDSAPVQAFAGYIGTLLNYWIQMFTQLGGAIWTNLVNTWTAIAPNVMTGLNNILLLWTLFWTDMSTMLETYGQPIIDGVVGLFNAIWLDAFDPAIKLLSQVWADFTGILLKTWEKYGKSILDNLGQFVTNTIGLFRSIWDNVLAPIIQPFLEMLTKLWNEHIKGMVDQVVDFVAKLVVFGLQIYNNFIAPIVRFLLEILRPAFVTVGNIIANVFGTIVGTISTVVGSIFGILGGLIDFLTGVFTGNWRKAWDGVKSIFSNIVNGLGAIFKAPLNLIIDLINGMISGINSIKIPDWVPGIGGKNLNIPKIPKLARGGIVDRATLAVVGEAGKEAVMPLENNTGWITQLAGQIAEQIGGGSGQPVNLTVKIGEDTIIRKVIDGINDQSYMNNEGVITV